MQQKQMHVTQNTQVLSLLVYFHIIRKQMKVNGGQ